MLPDSLPSGKPKKRREQRGLNETHSFLGAAALLSLNPPSGAVLQGELGKEAFSTLKKIPRVESGASQVPD